MMKQAFLMLSHLTLLSLTLNGCFSLNQGAEKLDLQHDIPRLERTDQDLMNFLVDAAISSKHNRQGFPVNALEMAERDSGTSLGELSRNQAPKRDATPRETMDELMADIVSALDYLEEEQRHDVNDLDKRPLQKWRTPSRRQHNFVRIGKRNSVDCGPQGCSPWLWSVGGSSGDDSRGSGRGSNSNDAAASAFSRQIPKSWLATLNDGSNSEKGVESLIDSWAQNNNNNNDNNNNNNNDDDNNNYNDNLQEVLQSGEVTKRGVNTFLRLGRRSGVDNSSPRVVLSFDGQQTIPSSAHDTQLSESDAAISTPFKRGRFRHKFVRIGRSTQPRSSLGTEKTLSNRREQKRKGEIIEQLSSQVMDGERPSHSVDSPTSGGSGPVSSRAMDNEDPSYTVKTPHSTGNAL
ncbi:hypothetical protein EGW08_013674 [Elysia chlorotica]|uniref:Uncharacterized protein n=1 Tax=Elysia chlorotica TaxID=188477 RepID=A0A433TAF7_ELYCH|nr:hypothetical protein EGW08_013674 [Elysia chlorotica]